MNYFYGYIFVVGLSSSLLFVVGLSSSSLSDDEADESDDSLMPSVAGESSSTLSRMPLRGPSSDGLYVRTFGGPLSSSSEVDFNVCTLADLRDAADATLLSSFIEPHRDSVDSFVLLFLGGEFRNSSSELLLLREAFGLALFPSAVPAIDSQRSASEFLPSLAAGFWGFFFLLFLCFSPAMVKFYNLFSA